MQRADIGGDIETGAQLLRTTQSVGSFLPPVVVILRTWSASDLFHLDSCVLYRLLRAGAIHHHHVCCHPLFAFGRVVMATMKSSNAQQTTDTEANEQELKIDTATLAVVPGMTTGQAQHSSLAAGRRRTSSASGATTISISISGGGGKRPSTKSTTPSVSSAAVAGSAMRRSSSSAAQQNLNRKKSAASNSYSSLVSTDVSAAELLRNKMKQKERRSSSLKSQQQDNNSGHQQPPSIQKKKKQVAIPLETPVILSKQLR